VYTTGGKDYVKRKKPDGTFGMRQVTNNKLKGGRNGEENRKEREEEEEDRKKREEGYPNLLVGVTAISQWDTPLRGISGVGMFGVISGVVGVTARHHGVRGYFGCDSKL
jgi:hypothetical protein